jgi:Domain of unknown function (DUF4266)
MTAKLLRVVAMATAISLVASCGIKPWVKSYERELLADPIMSLSRDPVSDAHLEHVYDVREAARGGGLSQGGGCGCN